MSRQFFWLDPLFLHMSLCACCYFFRISHTDEQLISHHLQKLFSHKILKLETPDLGVPYA